MLRANHDCDMLGVVGSNLKMVKFFMQRLWMLQDVVLSFGQVCQTMLHPGVRTSSIFNTQHVTTRCNRMAKHTQHVAPNNVAICCAEMLRSFRPSLHMLGQQCYVELIYCDRLVRALERDKQN